MVFIQHNGHPFCLPDERYRVGRFRYSFGGREDVAARLQLWLHGAQQDSEISFTAHLANLTLPNRHVFDTRQTSRLRLELAIGNRDGLVNHEE